MPVNRVTFSSNILLIRYNLSNVQRQYEKAAIAATTNKTINTLSDDSTVTSRLFNLRSVVVANEQYQKNSNEVGRKLNFIESQLSGAADVLQQIRDIGLQANIPTLGSDVREQLASQIAELKAQFMTFTNSRLDGKYVFSGTATDTPPFADVGGVTVFQANSNSNFSQLNASLRLETTMDGNSVFTGNVADAAGTTRATTLRNGTGVPLGLAIGDTINFGGNVTGAVTGSLTVTANTTLNDIASALQTAVRAAGAGTETVTVQPDGSLRVTAGATAVTGLTMTSNNDTAFNTAFTFPTPIASAGTGDSDALLTGTGEDIFDVFDDLQEAVRDGNLTDITTHMGRVESSFNQLLNARATVALRLKQLETVDNFISEESIRTLEDLANVEEANLDEVLSQLVLKETALKVVFNTTSQVLGVTANLQLSLN